MNPSSHQDEEQPMTEPLNTEESTSAPIMIIPDDHPAHRHSTLSLAEIQYQAQKRRSKKQFFTNDPSARRLRLDRSRFHHLVRAEKRLSCAYCQTSTRKSVYKCSVCNVNLCLKERAENHNQSCFDIWHKHEYM